MEDNNDKSDPAEICSVCRKYFEKGEGRFMKADTTFCTECYAELNRNNSLNLTDMDAHKSGFL